MAQLVPVLLRLPAAAPMPLPRHQPRLLSASHALQEKAGLERELKMARSQAEKLTKNMDKVRGCGWQGCEPDRTQANTWDDCSCRHTTGTHCLLAPTWPCAPREDAPPSPPALPADLGPGGEEAREHHGGGQPDQEQAAAGGGRAAPRAGGPASTPCALKHAASVTAAMLGAGTAGVRESAHSSADLRPIPLCRVVSAGSWILLMCSPTKRRWSWRRPSLSCRPSAVSGHAWLSATPDLPRLPDLNQSQAGTAALPIPSQNPHCPLPACLQASARRWTAS